MILKIHDDTQILYQSLFDHGIRQARKILADSRKLGKLIMMDRKARFRPKRRTRDGLTEMILRDKQVNEQTGAEVAYLTTLIRNKTPVVVTLKSGEEFSGWIEYYDKSFIRLTCNRQPNLFIYKDSIRYIAESKAD